MNDRPRKTLGWTTPAEAMAEEIAAIRSTVLLKLETKLPLHNRIGLEYRLFLI